MPRPKKPARLYERPDTGEWIIRDGGHDERTGCFGSDGLKAAEEKLGRYLTKLKDGAPPVPQPSAAVSIASVLIDYAAAVEKGRAAPERIGYSIEALAHFWGRKTCAEVTEDHCKKFVEWRMSGGLREAMLAAAQTEQERAAVKAKKAVTESSARKDLVYLRAALNATRGKRLTDIPSVWLPDESEPRPDWLTRSEFAAILWELWRGPRPRKQDGSYGPRQDRTKHAARIALCQFYTGSRPGTIGKTTWRPRKDGPWVDLQTMVWYRKGDREPKTVKARRPHGMTRRLFAHLARWHRLYGGSYVVEHPRHRGKPIGDIGSALETACEAAGIIRITPHTLKHTAITLAIQSGMLMNDAADYFSTSVETIQKTYWHHSPHHQARAIATMEHVGRVSAQIRPGTAQNAHK